MPRREKVPLLPPAETPSDAEIVRRQAGMIETPFGHSVDGLTHMA